jgi:hypothetical protein
VPSVEELIAIAKQSPKEGEKELSDVERFVIANNITEGPEQVLTFRAWYKYQNWSPAPLTLKMFNKEMCKIFTRHQSSGNRRFFLLNSEPFEGIPKAYENIRDLIAEEKAERTRVNKIKASI